MSSIEIRVIAPKSAAEARAKMPTICMGLSAAHGSLLKAMIAAHDSSAYQEKERLQAVIDGLMASMVELSAVELFLLNEELKGKDQKSST